MSLFENEDVILDVVLSFSDPFDMIRVLQVNKAFSHYISNDEFWRDMIRRRFDIDYQGQDPREMYIGLFYDLNTTKFTELNPSYHWIMYLLFFSGDMFNISFIIINPDLHMSSNGDGEDSDIDFLDLPPDILHIVERNAVNGKRSILDKVEETWIYLGMFDDVDVSTLLALHNPLDTELWMITEGHPDTDHLTISDVLDQIEPQWLSLLGYGSIKSIWEDTEWPESIRAFVDAKINEANGFGVEDTLNNFVMILNAALKAHRE